MSIFKNIFLIFFIISLSAYCLYSQNNYHCGTTKYTEKIYAQNPELKRTIDSINIEQRNTIREKSLKNTEEYAELIIPVVVHVVYDSTSTLTKLYQNIKDNQIYSAIETLNKDFNLLNDDRVNVPDEFKSLAGSANLRFVLANRDPSGNITTGITRTATDVTYWTLEDNVKYSSEGGKDPWDTKKYLNIWVCNLEDSYVAGYATLPEMTYYNSGYIQGIVIKSDMFGSVGSAANHARVVTHEVGHWVGLYHIWGDYTGCSSIYDDYIDDTPIQRTENYGCPEYPSASCSSNSDMFMNYMDYTDSYCQNIFTKGQVEWLRKRIDMFRKGIKTSTGYVGIDDKLFEKSFNISPNPVKDVINVNFAFQNHVFYYEIINTNSVVQSKGILSQNKINMGNNISNGVYFLRIYNASVNYVKKFIVLK
ncbi:MAG: hypothetical protein A2X12_07895 [Bacteroidetes bacterium GWE2_29_8]|nr:MAG: hypothetical protein A2X12_07895 [Bacteroidetes bacterium GWE2_29_8]